ncbi:hypothetical protein ACTXT7_012667 [Hymenolepis weldensis]
MEKYCPYDMSEDDTPENAQVLTVQCLLFSLPIKHLVTVSAHSLPRYSEVRKGEKGKQFSELSPLYNNFINFAQSPMIL